MNPEQIQKIEEYKALIGGLASVQNKLFEDLVVALELESCTLQDHIFDYVYNDGEETFQEYVDQYAQYGHDILKQ
jgi:hypothetical protein